jgi:hypothetical protein
MDIVLEFFPLMLVHCQGSLDSNRFDNYGFVYFHTLIHWYMGYRLDFVLFLIPSH